MRREDLDTLNIDYLFEDFCETEVQRYGAEPGGCVWVGRVVGSRREFF